MSVCFRLTWSQGPACAANCGERLTILNTTHPIGWNARDFAIQGIDGKTYSLAQVRGPKGALVTFLCNHCPYMKASINRIVAEANAPPRDRHRHDRDYAERHWRLSREFLRQHAALVVHRKSRRSSMSAPDSAFWSRQSNSNFVFALRPRSVLIQEVVWNYGAGVAARRSARLAPGCRRQ
jgi:hypothetical protein